MRRIPLAEESGVSVYRRGKAALRFVALGAEGGERAGNRRSLAPYEYRPGLPPGRPCTAARTILRKSFPKCRIRSALVCRFLVDTIRIPDKNEEIVKKRERFFEACEENGRKAGLRLLFRPKGGGVYLLLMDSIQSGIVFRFIGICDRGRDQPGAFRGGTQVFYFGDRGIGKDCFSLFFHGQTS